MSQMPRRRASTRAPSRGRLAGSSRVPAPGAGRLVRAARDRRLAAVAGALIVLTALSVFLAACGHQSKSAARGAEADTMRALSLRVDGLARDDEFSGAVLVARDGRVLFRRAYGLADRKHTIPNSVRTRFAVASIQKMFTAVAILQLVEAGKIELAAPLATYLPDYPNRAVANKVTIHQLLTHTAGTRDILDGDILLDVIAHRNELRTLADYVKRYGKRGLAFEPGSSWAYSNYGFILLGVVIEKVTGHSYYDYVRQHVYAPAGMTRTGSPPEGQAVPDRAIGYTKLPGPTELQRAIASRSAPKLLAAWVPNTEWLLYRGSSADSSYSTVEDLARFARALLSHKLLGRDATKLLITGKVRMNRTAEAEFGPRVRMAYGFLDARTAGGDGWFGGGGLWPGINGALRIYPKSDYVVAVLANIDAPAAQRIADYLDHRLPTKR